MEGQPQLVWIPCCPWLGLFTVTSSRTEALSTLGHVTIHVR
jgi:hypothetical protein